MAKSTALAGRSRDRRKLIPAEVLAHLPGCEGGQPPDAIERICGGDLGAIYRVSTREGDFAVRLRLASAPGARHDREARLHALAADAGLAPRLIHADPAGRFIVSEYVEGSLWRPEDFARASRLRALGEWMRELHGIAPPAVEPFDLLETARSYSERILRIRPAEAPLHEALLKRALEAERRSGAGEREPRIIHHDVHHSNLIDAGRLYLIDWEYAAVSDPLDDVACVLAYYPAATLHAGDLLEASGLAGQATPEMLQERAWLSLLTSYLWHRLLRLSHPLSVDEGVERTLLARLQA